MVLTFVGEIAGRIFFRVTDLVVTIMFDQCSILRTIAVIQQLIVQPLMWMEGVELSREASFPQRYQRCSWLDESLVVKALLCGVMGFVDGHPHSVTFTVTWPPTFCHIHSHMVTHILSQSHGHPHSVTFTVTWSPTFYHIHMVTHILSQSHGHPHSVTFTVTWSPTFCHSHMVTHILSHSQSHGHPHSVTFTVTWSPTFCHSHSHMVTHILSHSQSHGHPHSVFTEERQRAN